MQESFTPSASASQVVNMSNGHMSRLEAELGVMRVKSRDPTMGGLVPMETPPQLALKSCTLVCEADHCEVIIKPLQVNAQETAKGDTRSRLASVKRFVKQSFKRDSKNTIPDNIHLPVTLNFKEYSSAAVGLVHDTLMSSTVSPSFRIDLGLDTFIFQCPNEATRATWLSRLRHAIDTMFNDTYRLFRTAQLRVSGGWVKKGSYYLVFRVNGVVHSRTSITEQPESTSDSRTRKPWNAWADEKINFKSLPNTSTKYEINLLNAKKHEVAATFEGNFASFHDHEVVTIYAQGDPSASLKINGSFRELVTLKGQNSALVQRALTVDREFTIKKIQELSRMPGYQCWIPSIVSVTQHFEMDDMLFTSLCSADIDKIITKVKSQFTDKHSKEYRTKQIECSWKQLLRQESACSLALDTVLSDLAKPLLRRTILPLLRKAKPSDSLQYLAKIFEETCQGLCEALNTIPARLRRVLRVFDELARRNWPHHNVFGAILFARLLCPALANPQDPRFALAMFAPKAKLRTLVNLSKCLMKLAYNGTFDEDSTLYAMNEVIAREKVAVKQAFHKVVDEDGTLEHDESNTKDQFMLLRHVSVLYHEAFLKHRDILQESRHYKTMYGTLDLVDDLASTGPLPLPAAGAELQAPNLSPFDDSALGRSEASEPRSPDDRAQKSLARGKSHRASHRQSTDV